MLIMLITVKNSAEEPLQRVVAFCAVARRIAVCFASALHPKVHPSQQLRSLDSSCQEWCMYNESVSSLK